MIGIKIGSTYVVLDPASYIAIEMNNPWMAQSLLPGDYCFPFSAPFHPVNDQLFDLPRIINNTHAFETDYDCVIYIEGMPFIKGVLNVVRVAGDRYELTFASEVAKLKKAAEERKIAEFDLGGVRTIGTTTQDVVDHAKAVCIAGPATYDYCFPVTKNADFYGDANLDFLQFVNYYNADSQVFPQNAISPVDYTTNQYNLVPMPFLHYVLRQIMEQLGYILKGEFMDDDEYKTIYIDNDFALDLKQKKYYVKAIRTSTYTDSIPLFGNHTHQVAFENVSTGGGEDDDGTYSNTLYRYYIATEGWHTITSVIKTSSVNGSDVTAILRHNGSDIQTQGATLSAGVVTDVTVTRTMYFTAGQVGDYIEVFLYTANTIGNHTIYPDSTFTVSNDSASNLNIYAKEINLQNHVPDMLATDLLLAVVQTFGIAIEFEKNTNVVYFNMRERIINSPDYVDNTSIASPGPQIEKSKHPGFTFNFDFPDSDALVENNFAPPLGKTSLGEFNSVLDLPDPQIDKLAYLLNINAILDGSNGSDNNLYWHIASDNNLPLVIGSGGINFTPKVSPLFMGKSSTDIFPQKQQKGSSLYFEIGVTKNPDLRLMYYRGMQKNSANQDYPLGSSTIYDYAGNEIADYSFAWDGDTGLYELNHKAFTQFIMAAKLVTYNMNFTGSKLLELDFYKKSLVDRIKYFINRVRVNVTTTKIEQAIVEQYNL